MRYKVWISIFFIYIFSTIVSNATNDPIEFYYYDMPPYAYQNSQKQPEGLVIDLINHIAKKENWEIHFSYSDLTIHPQEIVSKENSLSFSYYDNTINPIYYSTASIYSDWGQVYSNQSIQSINSFSNQNIAFSNNQYHLDLEQLLEANQIKAHFIYAKNDAKVFSLIKNKQAEAGIVSGVYGKSYKTQYNVKATDILLYPQEMKFIGGSHTSEILQTIGTYLSQMQNEPNSSYFHLLEKWIQNMSNNDLENNILIVSAILGFVLLMMFFATIIIGYDLNEMKKDVEKNKTKRIKAEARYKLALDVTNGGIWEWMTKDNNLYISTRLNEMLSGNVDKTINYKYIYKRIHPNDRYIIKEKVLDIFRGATDSININVRYKSRDGNYKWVLCRGKATRYDSGKVIQIVGTYSDIDEIMFLTKEIEREKEFVSNIFETAKNLIFVLDKQGKTISISRYAKEILQYEEEEISSDLLHMIFPVYEQEKMLAYMRNVNKYPEGLKCDIITKDGKTRSILWQLSNISDAYGRREILFIGIDITATEKIQKEMQKLAYYDHLTGLPNRQSFMKELNRIIDEENMDFALMYIDLDNFKNINDVYGHDFGDKFLITIAQMMKECIDNQDGFVARLSGDEFAVILKRARKKNIDETAFMINNRLNEQIRIKDIIVDTTASIGIALYPQNAITDKELLVCADAAMYRAKAMGKNTFQYFDGEIYSEMVDKNILINHLKQAILNEEFTLYFQPIYNIRKKAIFIVETLVRWKKNDKIIPPDVFIPASEETGLIIPLGEWILKEAFKQAVHWRQKNLDIILTINISWVQLKQKTFVNTVEKMIKEIGVDPKWIIFEITEEVMFNMGKDVLKTVQELVAMGIQIALDDFGTEYSALKLLRKIPINYLKLDKANIRDFETDQSEKELLKGLIALGKMLQLDIIAEGIERESQLEFLDSQGCQNIQGHLVSVAKTADEIEETLVNINASYLKETAAASQEQIN